VSGLDTRGIELDKLAQAPAPRVEHRFRVFISEKAFDRATTRGGDDTTREVGGILVGEVCRDEAGPYVRVDTTIDALHAEEKGTELTFTHATWDHIHKEMDERHKDKRILGWYHTHPGFGIFLSDRDQFIHKSFFNLPYQIALVYDPKSREHGVFAWQENEPARCQRYWVGTSEYVWRPPAPPEPNTMETATERPSTSPPAGQPGPELDRASLLMGAVVLAILAGLIGWWLGSGTARAAVGKARTELNQQRVAGAQEMVKGLNTELLLMLRRSLGGEAMRRPIEQVLDDLAAGLTALEKDPADKEALASVRGAQRKLRELRDSHLRADTTLRSLAETSRQGRLDPTEVIRVLNLQAAAIGQICVELAEVAAKAGDRARALRLLEVAARIDPDKMKFYRRKLDELEKKR